MAAPSDQAALFDEIVGETAAPLKEQDRPMVVAANHIAFFSWASKTELGRFIDREQSGGDWGRGAAWRAEN
jgi:hypothetical protein